jgi:hypothetical protein
MAPARALRRGHGLHAVFFLNGDSGSGAIFTATPSSTVTSAPHPPWQLRHAVFIVFLLMLAINPGRRSV